LYTSWINGKLIFRDTPFKKIRKMLERFYNVSIVNEDLKLDKQTFNAVFDVEGIYEVLESFKMSYKIDYTINDNKIIINPKNHKVNELNE
jgi:ferric-dicitrate binding protein FerR (iron transport regulator)